MKKNIKNILREKIIRINLQKYELLRVLTKSISQNNNINNNYKNYTNLVLKKLTKNKYNLSKKNKICFYTGKHGGVYNYFDFSRHTIKKLILANKITNIKKNNW